MGGTWTVASEEPSKLSIWKQIHSMTVDGVQYLYNSWWGALVLLKGSGGIIYGACDVLNVSFSEPNGSQDQLSSMRLGVLFFCAGVGCVLGPLAADRLTTMKHAVSLQRACIISLLIMTVGLFGMGQFEPFWSICLFTVLRACGASINWLDSCLLLQKYSSLDMLGRVLAIDYALALLTEASTAYLCGILQDIYSFSANSVCNVMGSIGLFIFFCWAIFHITDRGAAAPQAATFQSNLQSKERIPSETTPLLI